MLHTQGIDVVTCVCQLPMYQLICCILSILPKAKYVAYATSHPVQHQLCCYCRIYEKESLSIQQIYSVLPVGCV